MTRKGLYVLAFLLALMLFAFFVWPTADTLRQIEIVPSRDTTSTRTYDAKRDSKAGQAMGRAKQATDDIKKMNEAANKVTDH